MLTCCQATHTTPLVVTRRLIQSSPLRSAVAAAAFVGGNAGAPAWNRGRATSGHPVILHRAVGFSARMAATIRLRFAFAALRPPGTTRNPPRVHRPDQPRCTGPRERCIKRRNNIRTVTSRGESAQPRLATSGRMAWGGKRTRAVQLRCRVSRRRLVEEQLSA